MAENKQRIQGVLAAMGWNESDFPWNRKRSVPPTPAICVPIAEIVMFCASARNIPGY